MFKLKLPALMLFMFALGSGSFSVTKKKEKRRNTFGDVCWYVVMTEGLFLVWGIPMFLNNKMNAFVE
jgi:hypothetical protein